MPCNSKWFRDTFRDIAADTDTNGGAVRVVAVMAQLLRSSAGQGLTVHPSPWLEGAGRAVHGEKPPIRLFFTFEAAALLGTSPAHVIEMMFWRLQGR
jgi:hypothetical protein